MLTKSGSARRFSAFDQCGARSTKLGIGLTKLGSGLTKLGVGSGKFGLGSVEVGGWALVRPNGLGMSDLSWPGLG